MSLLLILFVAACGGKQATEAPSTRYILPEKPGGRVCSFQCRSAFEHCSNSCNITERTCYNDMQTRAIKDYEDYAREQFKARAPLELLPRDFERAAQCEASGCRRDCKAHYDKCFEDCGGTVVNPSTCGIMCF